MAKLSSADRNALPADDFAGPSRSYPVNNMSHARNALARVSEYGTADLKKRVSEKVYRKFPGIKQGD